MYEWMNMLTHQLPPPGPPLLWPEILDAPYSVPDTSSHRVEGLKAGCVACLHQGDILLDLKDCNGA